MYPDAPRTVTDIPMGCILYIFSHLHSSPPVAQSAAHLCRYLEKTPQTGRVTAEGRVLETRTRLLSAISATTLVLALIVAFAHPALAQIPGVDETVDSVKDTVDDTADTAGDTAGGVGDTVGDTVDDAGETVGDAVDGVGDTVGDTVGGDTGAALDDAIDGVGGTIKDTADDAGGTAGGTVGSVEDAVKGSEAENGTEGNPGTSDPSNPDGSNPSGENGANGDRAGSSDEAGGGSEGGFDSRSEPVSGTLTSPDSLREFAELIIEQAARFAFPLALAIAVAIFLAIQARIDSRDPKLAMALVEPLDDHLSFS